MLSEPQALSKSGRNNRILRSLDSDVYQRLAPQLELVTMNRGERICPPGSKLSYAYFPTSCIISLSHLLQSGASGETAVIGNEGMLGVTIFIGGYTMADEASVQIEGDAYRISAEVLMNEFNRSASTRNKLLKYTLALFAQTSQTAICNRHHSLQQQLCRRLLLTLDRVSGNNLYMTQEQIASILGVRREGISVAASRLQLAGVINYNRGRITVLNRDLLERHACECYQVVKKECERLENIAEPPRKHLPYSTERRRRPRPAPPSVASAQRH